MAKRRTLTKLTLSELSGVDNPCQEHAKVSIMKRAPEATPLTITKATFEEALNGQLVAERVQRAFWDAFDNLWSRNDAFRTALTDELADGGDGKTASAAYVASIQELAERAVEAAVSAGTKPLDAEELKKSFNATAEAWLVSKQEKPMFKFTTKAALLGAIAKFAPATASAQDIIDIQDSARELGEEASLPADGLLAKAAPDPALASLRRENEVLKMAPAIRKHFDALDAAGQTAFLAKSADQRQADVDAIEKGDPIVYTCADGTPIRKSDGAVAALMAKRMDQQAVEIAGLRADAAGSSIEKRLTAYPNIAKAVATSMLKTIDQMPEAERPAALEAMAAQNTALGGVFKRRGSTAGGGSLDIEKTADGPIAKMASIVKSIMDDEKIDEATATVKASTRADYQEAYAESVNATPQVESAA